MSVVPVSAQNPAAEAEREHPEDHLTRDRWGRPEINPPSGGRKTGYRRASSFGSPLESDWNLQLWGKRQVARGIARRDALSIAVTRAEVKLDDPDPAVVKAAKRELDDLAEQAMQVVESGDKASIGTSIHHICELLDLGRDPGHIPASIRADIDAYRELTEPRFKMVSVERFVVHDKWKVAGTLDRVAELKVEMVAPDGTVLEPGQAILADVKTSQDMTWAGAKFACQVCAYCDGIPYNTKTGQREEWGHATPRPDWAMIIHIPSMLGAAALYWVDLDNARIAAEQALLVHEWRNRRGKLLISKAEQIDVPEDWHATAAAATSVEELTSAYHRAVTAGAWDDVTRQAFSRRKRELAEEGAA